MYVSEDGKNVGVLYLSSIFPVIWQAPQGVAANHKIIVTSKRKRASVFFRGFLYAIIEAVTSTGISSPGGTIKLPKSL